METTAYDVLLDGAKAATVFTDPPYNVKIDGHACGLGAIKHREFAMASGEMTSQTFERFLAEALRLIGAYTDPGAVIYACMDWRHMAEMLAAGCAAHLDLLNLCVWVKSNGGMGSLYRSRHELIFAFRNGKEQHRNNVQLGSGAIAPTSGIMPAPTAFRVRVKDVLLISIPRSSRLHWFPTPFWIRRSAMRSFWIPFAAAARPYLPPSAPAGTVAASRSIRSMWTLQSSVGRE